MFKLIWRIGCLSVLLIIAFVLFSMWRGGGLFREVGGKSVGIIRENSKKLGDKADMIKEKTDAVKNTMKKWSDKLGSAGGPDNTDTDKKEEK